MSKEAELPKDVVASIQKMRREPGRVMTSALFTRAVETMKPQESLEYDNGVPLFTLHQPIPNQEKCQGCHGTESPVRAVVRVATSMEPVFAEVRAQRNRQILVGLLTIAAAAVVLAVGMRRVVVRPVQIHTDDEHAVGRRAVQGEPGRVRAAAVEVLAHVDQDVAQRPAVATARLAGLAEQTHDAAHARTPAIRRRCCPEPTPGSCLRPRPPQVDRGRNCAPSYVAIPHNAGYGDPVLRARPELDLTRCA